MIERAPADKIAIILPEQDIRVTYGALRAQVQAVAEQLAAAGVRRGDRVASALPNGLPAIVSFLAASVAGTAAPLNPAYKEDEFRFYLEDTAREGPDSAARRRRRGAARRRRRACRFSTIDMDASGTVSLSGVGRPHTGQRRRRSTTSRWCCTRAAAPAGRSACRSTHANLSISARQRRAQLRARRPTMCRCA